MTEPGFLKVTSAGATLRDAATILGARKSDDIAYGPKQRHFGIGIDRVTLVVDF